MNNILYVESDHEIFTQPGGYTNTLGGYLIDTKVADRMVASANAVTITKVWERNKKPYIPTHNELDMYEQRLADHAHKIRVAKGVWPARISTFQVKATVDIPVMIMRDMDEAHKFHKIAWDLCEDMCAELVKHSKVMVAIEATGGRNDTREANVMIVIYGTKQPDLWVWRFEQEILPKLQEATKHLA